ncbi:hypothetical protein PV327_005956 [Microctonus hyperodae]|uniref:TMEM205-like domain-containing protein n=1 Tax=Microctonus hyperodae TaxID=165561 RepID=A0AA39L0D1_MICHY|nr:hypothetical protein PV327_005956 [Microctonus hyperodae]
MCIRGVTTGDENDNEMQNQDQHISQDESQYSDVPDAVLNSEMIPDRVKTKIQKAIDKYTDRLNKIDAEPSNNEKKTSIQSAKETDVVAQTVNQFRIFTDFTTKYWETFQQSNAYKILFRTTQPAHVIAIVSVLCVVSAVVPKSDDKINNANESHSKLLSLIYLTSFALHMGSQFWMTFVSGLSLFFALPKRDFSEVQRILFPRYFTLNTCFSITTLVIFLKYHAFHTWNVEISIQIGALFTAFFLELVIRLYLTPPLIGLLSAKVAIEKAAGIGTKVNSHSLGPLENCPHYIKMNRAFRKIHTIIAIGNILTMVCTVIHLNYMAGKICF